MSVGSNCVSYYWIKVKNRKHHAFDRVREAPPPSARTIVTQKSAAFLMNITDAASRFSCTDLREGGRPFGWGRNLAEGPGRQAPALSRKHLASDRSDCLLLHGQREILEPIPGFRDMPDAGPREVIG